jgi:CO/xanthine dehydrogenase FAD-binding subunit
MFATLGTFEYYEPRSIEAALRLLSELGRDVRILAGGCELIPDLRRRESAPRAIVSIAHIAELNQVRLSDEELVIGALASLRVVERRLESADDFAALFEGIGSIASVQVRNTGTLVGNLCVATPASDIATPLIVLGAEVHVASPQGVRTMPVFELFRSAKRNSLQAGEMVTEVRVKRPAPGTGSAFAKLTRTAADCAKLNAAGAVVVQDQLCTDVRLALGAVAGTPVRAPRAEDYLRGRPLEPSAIAQAAAMAAEDVNPITDIRSTAEYRREATRVLVERVLSKASVRTTWRQS